jgi:hypothetical protein
VRRLSSNCGIACKLLAVFCNVDRWQPRLLIRLAVFKLRSSWFSHSLVLLPLFNNLVRGGRGGPWICSEWIYSESLFYCKLSAIFLSRAQELKQRLFRSSFSQAADWSVCVGGGGISVFVRIHLFFVNVRLLKNLKPHTAASIEETILIMHNSGKVKCVESSSCIACSATELKIESIGFDIAIFYRLLGLRFRLTRYLCKR